jgi:hypothetical protein
MSNIGGKYEFNFGEIKKFDYYIFSRNILTMN